MGKESSIIFEIFQWRPCQRIFMVSAPGLCNPCLPQKFRQVPSLTLSFWKAFKNLFNYAFQLLMEFLHHPFKIILYSLANV